MSLKHFFLNAILIFTSFTEKMRKMIFTSCITVRKLGTAFYYVHFAKLNLKIRNYFFYIYIPSNFNIIPILFVVKSTRTSVIVMSEGRIMSLIQVTNSERVKDK